MIDRVPPGPPSSEPRGDGVRIIKRDGSNRSGQLFKWVVAALVGVCVVLGAVLLWPKQAVRQASTDAIATTSTEGDAEANALMTTHRDGTTPENSSRLAAADDISNYIPPGEAPPMAEVIERLNKAGVHTGLGAFSPPGTSPPMVGLSVPEDFDLPEGYVRHYQATDDGQRIDPILMYSPDFEFLDAEGRQVRMPPDMVVPPNMAPPGLPIKLIKIPPAIAPQGSPT